MTTKKPTDFSPAVFLDHNNRPAILISRGNQLAHLVGRKINGGIGVIDIPLHEFNREFRDATFKGAEYPVIKAAKFWLKKDRQRKAQQLDCCCSKRAVRILRDIIAEKKNISLGSAAEDEAPAVPEQIAAPAPIVSRTDVVKKMIQPRHPRKPVPGIITAATKVEFVKGAFGLKDNLTVVLNAVVQSNSIISIGDLRKQLGRPCRDHAAKLVQLGHLRVCE